MTHQYQLSPVPASDHTVALYLSFMDKNLCSESKVNSIIYGISQAHKSTVFPEPCSLYLVRNVNGDILIKHVHVHVNCFLSHI